MRATTATLAAAMSSTTATPAARLTLYRTPHGDSLLGPLVVAWKGTESDAGDPWLGRPLGVAAAAPDPWTDPDLILAERGQLSGWWGMARPYGLSPADPHVLGFEGFWRHPVTGPVELLLIGNGYPVSLYFGAASADPGTLVVSYNATRNVDQRAGTSWTTPSYTAGDWYALRVRVVLKPGAYGKVSLLWRPSGATTWRLADASVLSVRASAESSYTLPGVVSLEIGEEPGRAGELTATVAPSASALYTYDPDVDAWGILRPGSRIVAELGYTTTAGVERLQVGEFYLDAVELVEPGEGGRSLKLTMRDALGKAADELALTDPDVLAYDLAGYSSDDVWLAPDQLQRYTAYDSWTLAETFRAVLYRAGLSSRQLHASDAFGDLIQEAGVRLARGATYRVKLPQIEKLDTLQYAPEAGTRLLDFLEDLADQFGYTFRVNGSGEVVLREREPVDAYAVDDPALTYTGTVVEVENVNAYGGREAQLAAGATVTHTNAQAATGLRLVFQRSAAAGTVVVEVDGEVLDTLDLSYPRTWRWRDGVDPSAGVNPCVFEYRGISGVVELTATTAVVFEGLELMRYTAEDSAVEFNGSRERLTYTTTNAAIRNDVIVAGAAAGPDALPIVARAVDLGSIGRPSSPNFLGRRRLFLYPDPRILRQEQAAYVAYKELLRTRTLADAVEVATPGRPDLELEDAAAIRDVDTGDLLPGLRYVDRAGHSWQATPDSISFASTFRLSPAPPLESYRLPLAPLNPSATVSGFEVARSDGVSIDPDLKTGTTLSGAEYTARAAGCYCPAWADEGDAVHLVVRLNAWRPGFLTLEVKDIHTHRTVAVLAEDLFLDWGAYSFLWGGRWYTADGSAFLYFPQDPESTEADWSAYQERTDPVRGGDLGRAGWVYFEARFDPLDSSVPPVLATAVNASDTARTHVHLIMQNKAANAGAILAAAQPVYGTKTTVLYGGRYDVRLDEWTPGLPRGFKFYVGHQGEDLKHTLGGWVDVFIVVYNSTDWLDGMKVYRLPLVWDTESVARGRHLWNIDGTPTLVAGETDYLPGGEYTFLLDPVGLPLKLDPAGQVYGEAFKVVAKRGTVLSDLFKTTYTLERTGSAAVPKMHLDYRDDFLEFLASLFPGKVVAAGFHWGSSVTSRNRAGETLRQEYRILAYRWDTAANASHKHGVFPPVAVVQGGTTMQPGRWWRLQVGKDTGDSNPDTWTPHLTLPASYTAGNLHYD